jgi:cell wall synthesis protein CwsA
MTSPTGLTPTQRLTRGLHYTTVGPIDITRGTVGLGVHSAYLAGGALRHRYRARHEAGQPANELNSAQEVVAALPQALQEPRRPKHGRRRLVLLTALGVAALAGGAVAFSIVRRSMQPDPSPRPPSVEVAPRP